MILYVENPKDFSKKTIPTLHFGSKIQNRHKTSVALQNANSGLSEIEIKKAIPFTISTKINCRGINLIKEVKYIYNKNHKILMRKAKRTQKNGKKSYVDGLEKSTLLKCPHYPKQPTDSMQY